MPILNSRYNIIKHLGDGGMGAVYLAEDILEDNQQLALKTILPNDEFGKMLDLFKHEFEAMTQLRHPNLVGVYDFGRIDGTEKYFFTMDYVPGQNIKQVTRPMVYGELLEYIVQICRALDYIHSRGFIHFDLKPENILIQSDTTSAEQVKLTDFGLVGRKGLVTTRGTIFYMSPEMILGENVDCRTDLYALGCTLYECISGRPLFSGTINEIAQAHLEEEPLRLRVFDPTISRKLETIISTLLEKKVDKRYPGARNVIEAISEITGRNYFQESITIQEESASESAFIGRKQELTLLKRVLEFLESDANSTPILTTLTGEAGIGKSRLLDEYRYHVQLQDVIFCKGNCAQNNVITYQPWRTILRTMVSRAESDYDQLLKPYAAQLAKLVPELAEKYEIITPVIPEIIQRAQSQKLQFQKLLLFETIVDFIAANSRKKSCVIAIDNAQWSDNESMELLAHFLRVQQLDRTKIMICLITRCAEQIQKKPFDKMYHGFSKQNQFLDIPISSFTNKEAAELINYRLPSIEISSEVITEINQTANGNPFFLEEAARLLAEAQLSDLSDFEKVKEHLILPQTVEKVLENSLKKLPTQELRLLRILAECQRPVPLQLLKQISGDSNINTDIQTLIRKGFVERIQSVQGYEYGLRQSQLQQVLSQMTDRQERELFHTWIGKAFEKLYADNVQDHLEWLAEQFLQSQEVKKAIVYGMRAIEELEKVYAADKIVVICNKILNKIENSLQAKQYRSQQVETLQKKANALDRVGNMVECEQVFILLLSKFLDILNVETQIQIHILLAGVQLKLGKMEETYRTLQNGISIAGKTKDTVRKLWLQQRLAMYYYHDGDYDKQQRILSTALNMARKLSDSELIAALLNDLGINYTRLGDLDQALIYHFEALKIQEIGQDQREVARTYGNIGIAYNFHGQPDKALEFHQKSLDVYKIMNDKAKEALCLGNIAIIYAQRGDYKDAERYLKNALILSKRLGHRHEEAFHLLNLANLYEDTNDLSNALKHIDLALTLFESLKSKDGLVSAYAMQGEIYYKQSQWEDASRCFKKSYNLAIEIGDRRVELQVLGYLGILEMQEGELKKGYAICVKAMKISKKLDFLDLLVTIKAEVGSLLREKHNRKLGTTLLKEALATAKNLELSTKIEEIQKKLLN